jgi:imidazolonepropionase-like amidohydrolase
MNDPTKTIVFKNAMIIDGTGAEPLEDGTVVVEGERIREVLDGPAGHLPASVEVVQCRGKTLMPGLIDAHVHIGSVEADIGEQQRRTYPSVLVIRTLKIMKECLDQGFTAVRDCGGADAGFRIATRDGLVPGPRLAVCGKGLSMTGGHGDGRLPTETYDPVNFPAGLSCIVADGVDACRKAAREQLRQGADFIKVMAGGGCMSPADEIDTAQYSRDELKAIVWEAESAGKYVAAHCYSDRSIRNSIESGIKTIEHGNLMTEPVARELKAAGACLVPTVVAYEVMSEQGESFGVPSTYIAKIRQAREKALESLAAAYKVGCVIGLGSDCLGPMQVNKARELALQARVMGPMGAIVAATKTNSAIIGWDKDLGTIEAGKLADLILVDGNPLENVAILQDYQERLTVVMQNGRFYKNIA